MVDIIENNSVLEDSENKEIKSTVEEVMPFVEEIKPFADEPESPYAKVKGIVTSSDGISLEGALVKLMSLTYEPKFHNTTEISGEYKITNVDPGVYKIYAIAKGKILPEGKIITAKPSDEIEVNFTLEDDPDMKLALIAGDVFDQNSKKPLEKALVSLYSIEYVLNGTKESLVGITQTNKYGQFTFRDLKLQDYNITIGFTGYGAKNVLANAIYEGQIIPIQVGLVPISNGTVSGLVKNEKNNPIDGADVILYKVEDDEQLTPVAFTKTNNEGLYLFQDVEKSAYKVKANEATKVALVAPNSPDYYSFSIATASTINPEIISIEEARLYNGTEYTPDNKFVRRIGRGNDGYITININAKFGGYYDISIKYVSAILEGTTIILQEDPDNNGIQTPLIFEKTNSWYDKDAKYLTVNMPLYAGINKFKLFNISEAFSPWIGDFSLIYTKNSYNLDLIHAIVGNGAVYVPPFISNLGGATNGEVTIFADVPFTQTYNLQIKYLSGDTNRPLKIDVDGVNQVDVNLPKTNDWGIASAKIYEAKVHANEGEVQFKLYNDTGETAANIVDLILEEYTIDKFFAPQDVVLLDGAKIKTDITGEQYISGVTSGLGKIKFSINVFETQLYDFQITYKCSEDKTCIVEVNDRIVVEREFIFKQTGNAIGEFNTQLFLYEGVNTVAIYNE